MTVRASVVGVLIAAAVVLGGGLPAVAQAPAQAGPAAAVITTTVQQQTILTALQPRPIQSYTMIERRGVPVLVYADGHEFVMMDPDECVDRWRAANRGQGNFMPEPDPIELIDRSHEEMPYTEFVHCLDYQTPTRSQAGRGTCHCFAATALLESLIKRRLMRAGVPEQLAEVDLSEEWMVFHSMRGNAADTADGQLGSEGGWCVSDWPYIYNADFPVEAFWPYCPESWPDLPDHPAQIDWQDGRKCAWEYWAHRDPGQKTPASIADFREYCSPAGPMPAVRPANARSVEGDTDAALAHVREQIEQGRPVAMSLIWPSIKLCNPQKSMYCVTEDYPFEVQAKKAGPDALTQDEIDIWNQYYLGGHEVLLVGYGRAGTECEGIWLMKNSHGTDAGNNGIVPITESLLRLSFPGFYEADLSETTREDLDRFAATMLEQLAR